MRALSLPAVVLAAAGLASLPGCGGKEKELPKVVQQGDEKGTTPAVVVPAKSEPEALAVVERAIKATTDGHPERLQKAKNNRLKLKGTLVGTGVPIPTGRDVEAAWPDRFAQTDEMDAGDSRVKILIRLRRPVLWVGNSREGKTVPVEPPDPKASEAALSGELVGRHWMALLVPLTDPKTVVFAAKKETVNGQAADIIKAAVTGAPVFTLWFDEKTGLLGRIDFSQIEPGATAPTQKFFSLLQHRVFDGVMLPARVEHRQNGLPVEEWNVVSWEFPERLDDATFDAPK
jgi:hypothetical protein